MYLMLAWLKDYMNFDWYLILVVKINHLFDIYMTYVRKKRKNISFYFRSSFSAAMHTFTLSNW